MNRRAYDAKERRTVRSLSVNRVHQAHARSSVISIRPRDQPIPQSLLVDEALPSCESCSPLDASRYSTTLRGVTMHEETYVSPNALHVSPRRGQRRSPQIPYLYNSSKQAPLVAQQIPVEESPHTVHGPVKLAIPWSIPSRGANPSACWEAPRATKRREISHETHRKFCGKGR